MSKINGDDPAMPTGETFDSDGRVCETGYSGLTIRQQFAAMAMQGIVSGMNNDQLVGHRSCDSEGVAGLAVVYADALIAELNK